MHVCTALHSKTSPIGSAALGTVKPAHPNPAPSKTNSKGLAAISNVAEDLTVNPARSSAATTAESATLSGGPSAELSLRGGQFPIAGESLSGTRQLMNGLVPSGRSSSGGVSLRMKLPAGLITKPDWLRLSTQVVIVPSLPQLTVW